MCQGDNEDNAYNCNTITQLTKLQSGPLITPLSCNMVSQISLRINKFGTATDYPTNGSLIIKGLQKKEAHLWLLRSKKANLLFCN